MATPLRTRPSRRGARPAVACTPVSAAPPPALDLAAVSLPDWLMPAIRDIMDVAERTFGPANGPYKKHWVRESVHQILYLRNVNDEPSVFAPEEHRRALLDILIEGVWGLGLPPRSAATASLEAAIEKMKRLGGRFSRLREAEGAP